MFDISAMIKAIANMFDSFFNWKSVAIENQTVSEVIKDKNNTLKACGIAEEAITLAERYAVFHKSKHRRHFISKVKKFRQCLASGKK